MSKRPVFIIIGEVHPTGMEALLTNAGIISTYDVQRKINGKTRTRERTSKEPSKRASSKKYLRFINGLLNEQAEILKKEGIERLFVEEPATKSGKAIFARYKKTRAFKQLQSACREDLVKSLINSNNRAKRIISGSGLCQEAKEAYNWYFEEPPETMRSKLFALSYLTVAHRAKIYDVIPVDSLQESLEECSARILTCTPDVSRDVVQHGIASQLIRFSKILGKNQGDMQEFNRRREAVMYKNIMDVCRGDGAWVPIALICGDGHVKPLKKLLSKHFEVRTYHTGEEQWKTLGRTITMGENCASSS